MTKILQMRISLRGIRPTIWRRFLVKDSMTFHKLHRVIQEVMGWEDGHLYAFSSGDLRICEPNPDYCDEATDSRKTRVGDVLAVEGQNLTYLYDFGDSWTHAVRVEKVMEDDGTQDVPRCLTGKQACPPEDCGGAWGYDELLRIRKDKNHPDHKEKIVGWLGEDVDPALFDAGEVNARLRKASRRGFR